MKKVKCIDEECNNLTFEKEYEILDTWKEKSQLKPYDEYDVYLVIDDTGNKSVEPYCLFSVVR